MSESIIQTNFGGFNPRFPGVTLKIDSEAAFEVLRDFLTPQSVITDESNLEAAAIRSVLDHEARHYHDFLISPHSAMLFRMRVQAAFNGANALHRLRSRPGHYLPVPVIRWTTLPAEERAPWVAEFCEVLGKADQQSLGLVDLPCFAQDLSQSWPNPGAFPTHNLSEEESLHLEMYFTCLAYSKIRDLSAGPATIPELGDLAPWTLYEQTALAAQGQAIWEGQGAKACKVFMDELFSSGLPYARVWRFLLRLAQTVEHEVRKCGMDFHISLTDQISAITLWCLLGNYWVDGNAGSPSARLIKLSRHLIEDSTELDMAADVAKTWEYWDLITRSPSWRHSLSEMQVSNQRTANQYLELAAQGKGLELLARVMQRYVADQRRIVNHLLSEPTDLVHMKRYCHLGSKLPMPLLRIEFHGLGVLLEQVQDSPFEPISTRRGDDNREYATRVALRGQRSSAGSQLDDAAEFESLMHKCDLVFSQHEMPSDMHMFHRRTVEEFLGKRLLSLV